jgi:hypothetical protein
VEYVRKGGGKDAEKTFAKKAFFPSSMGLSLLVNENTTHLNAIVAWGDYSPYKENLENIDIAIENQTIPQGELETTDEKQTQIVSGCWKRIPHQVEITIPLQVQGKGSDSVGGVFQNSTIPIADSNGLKLLVSVRPVPSKQLVPTGTDTFNLDIFEHQRHSQYLVQHHQQNQ